MTRQIMNDKWTDQQINPSKLDDHFITKSVFTNCRVLQQKDVTFKECTFENCDFSGTNLSYVKFIACSIINCNFQNIVIFGTALLEFQEVHFPQPCSLVSVSKVGKREFGEWRVSTFSGFVQGSNFRGAVIFAKRLDVHVLFGSETNDFTGAWLAGCMTGFVATRGYKESHINLYNAAKLTQQSLAKAICPDLSYVALAAAKSNEMETFWGPYQAGVSCPDFSVLTASLPQLLELGMVDEGNYRFPSNSFWHGLSTRMFSNKPKSRPATALTSGEYTSELESVVLQAAESWVKELANWVYESEPDRIADFAPGEVARAVASLVMQQKAMRDAL